MTPRTEREECGYCQRTEGEGHAPSCPDRSGMTPRTKAGRDMVAWQAGINGFDRAYWDKRIVEIEREAAALDADRIQRAFLNLGLSVSIPHDWTGGVWVWPEIAAEYARLAAEPSE